MATWSTITVLCSMVVAEVQADPKRGVHGVQARLVGVKREASGHARNYAELHPVTAFRVLTG